MTGIRRQASNRLGARGARQRRRLRGAWGPYTGVHQYSRVGESVMTASNTKLSLDAALFSIVAGDRARWVGVNHVGLERRGFSRVRRQQIKRAFHILIQSQLSLSRALESVRKKSLPSAFPPNTSMCWGI